MVWLFCFFFKCDFLYPKPFSFRSASLLFHATSTSIIISWVLRQLFLDSEGKLEVVFPLALFFLIVTPSNLYQSPSLGLCVGFIFSLLWGCWFKAFSLCMKGVLHNFQRVHPAAKGAFKMLHPPDLKRCNPSLEFSLPTLACGRGCFGERGCIFFF